MKSGILAGGLFAGALLAGGAHAASFDCAKAATPMEAKICTVPAVSKADDDLAAAYEKALAGVSPDGQVALRASERSFLQYADELCRPGRMPLNAERWTKYPDPKPDLSANCLEYSFQERTRTLNQAVLRLGGHIFLATVTYRARPHREKGEAEPSAALPVTLTLVQIDAPGPDETRWNAEARAKLQAVVSDNFGSLDGQAPEDSSNGDFGIDLVSASPDLISAVAYASTYTEGMAHPEASNTGFTWLLQAGRELKAEDIFDPSQPWDKALVPIAQKHLEFDPDPPDSPFEIKHIAPVEQWRLMKQGLRIDYASDELGNYLESAQTTLPWADLKPWLRKTLPFDPAKIEAAPNP